jgi:hypothetical protein
MQPCLSTAMNNAAAVAGRLLALALLLLLAACQPTGLATASAPTSSPAVTDDPSLTPVPAGPTATPADAGQFEPPAPGCPSPVDPLTVPEVTVSVGAGPAIVATAGPSTLVTCTMTSASDTISSEPPNGLSAHAGDVLRLSLPAGWQLLHWEGSDRPAVGEGANVWPGADTPQRPRQIDVPVPVRDGESIVGYTLWVISADGRVVGQLEITIGVTIG